MVTLTNKKNKLPKGWVKVSAVNKNGYYWATNNKSRFSKEFKQALVKDPVAYAAIQKANKEWKQQNKEAERIGREARAKLATTRRNNEQKKTTKRR